MCVVHKRTKRGRAVKQNTFISGMNAGLTRIFCFPCLHYRTVLATACIEDILYCALRQQSSSINIKCLFIQDSSDIKSAEGH